MPYARISRRRPEIGPADECPAMAIGYKARRRWALVILLVALPLYVVAAVTIVGWFDRPGTLAELVIYLGLGILWALPFRAVFRGVGKPDPDRENAE